MPANYERVSTNDDLDASEHVESRQESIVALPSLPSSSENPRSFRRRVVLGTAILGCFVGAVLGVREVSSKWVGHLWSSDREQLPHLFDSAYSQTLAVAFLQYARATVCGHEEIEKWDCGEMCQAVPADPTAVRFLPPGTKHEVQGFVAALPRAYDHDRSSRRPGRHCVIAFRGSVIFKNWVADFDNIINIPWPPGGASWCPHCEVGDGYAGAYNELHDRLFEAVDELGCGDASLTGHSLGGALAVLAALELRKVKDFRAAPVYLFGCPRVGNAEFVQVFETSAAVHGVSPPSWRLVHDKDPVPRLGAWSFKSRHVPAEVYYTEAQDSYKICSSTEGDDPTCSSSIPWYECVSRTAMHLDYLNSSRAITCRHTGLNPWKTHGVYY